MNPIDEYAKSISCNRQISYGVCKYSKDDKGNPVVCSCRKMVENKGSKGCEELSNRSVRPVEGF